MIGVNKEAFRGVGWLDATEEAVKRRNVDLAAAVQPMSSASNQCHTDAEKDVDWVN